MTESMVDPSLCDCGEGYADIARHDEWKHARCHLIP